MKSEKHIDEFYGQIKDQHAKLERMNFISPAVNTQEMLNSLAATDLQTEFDFKAAVNQFHGTISGFSIKQLFASKMMTIKDYSSSPAFHFNPKIFQKKKLLVGLLELVLVASLLTAWGYKNLSEKKLIK